MFGDKKKKFSIKLRKVKAKRIEINIISK